jgi:nitroimidazol reductase NimA-like FMN-containing flavoprotein (pyridoxamine 5'-phosphate oxidase superfamily)
MLAKIKALAKEKNICVLATVSDNKPHCSLMAYIIDEDCREIYMVTHKQTKKFFNLTTNPSVSLLVDTRGEKPRSRAQALTIEGVFQKIENTEKRKLVLSKFLEIHPHMKEFINHSDAEPICIKVTSFLLLDGLTNSHFETVAPSDDF